MDAETIEYIEKEVKEVVEKETEIIRLENKTAQITVEGIARESAQCFKNVESNYSVISDSVAKTQKALMYIKKWLTGTNGDDIDEQKINNSFIVRFEDQEKILKKILENMQPWYLKVWKWAKVKPIQSITLGLAILGTFGVSVESIMKFLTKFLEVYDKLGKIVQP